MSSRLQRAFFVLFLVALTAGVMACGPKAKSPSIVIAKDASSLERYAAAELRRYLYLRTGEVPSVLEKEKLEDADDNVVILAGKGRPLFAVRGIQPFHDFPEGPDWWDVDNYKAILGQLPKLRMNFFGLHTYPEKGPNAEPTVWIGRSGDGQADGVVTSSYPSSYQNSLRGNWGYEPKRTGDYRFGASI